ncbi:MAG TPA: AAA family ATPase [Terriglobia bacterium]|nr:AAA family ATPase [Terriglobia bacterium]
MPFSEFLGNPQAVAEIRAMLKGSRVPGALLFAGPDGVGKKVLALMLAKALNCERLKDDFCGECRHCRKAEEMLAQTREDLGRRRAIKESQRRVEGLVYFDLQLVEPLTRNILIEQIRQVRNVAYTHPFEFRQRIFIIDQAQAVHWQAVDLLLKMLEEPPETTTFILVCPNAHELRPTIRSRCQRIQFLPVEDSVIARVLEDEGRLPPSQRALGLRLATGSISRAKALDVAAFERERRPWIDFLDSVAGSADRRPASHAPMSHTPARSSAPTRVSSSTPTLPGAAARAADRGAATEPNWAKVFDSAKALTADREAFEATLRTGAILAADLLHVLVSGAESPAVVNLDLAPRLAAWASRLGLEGIERLKNGLDQAYRLQTRNVNQQLGLEVLAIDVSHR